MKTTAYDIPDWVNAAYDRNHYGIVPYIRLAAKWLSLLGLCLLLCMGI